MKLNLIKILTIGLMIGVGLWGATTEVIADADCTLHPCYCSCSEPCSPCDPAPPGEDPPPWACFPAGTGVLMEDGQEKNIEDVKVEDKVISQSEEGKKSISTVIKLDQPVRDHMCQIKFTGGDSLKLTDEHPLFSENSWKAINPENTFKDNPNLAVSKLETGDKISKSDGSPSAVESISCWSEKIQTYNLILDNANTYFAGGFLAHNKGEHPVFTCPEGQIIVHTGQFMTHCIRYDEDGSCTGYTDCWSAYACVPVGCFEFGGDSCQGANSRCEYCYCVPACTATAPTNLTATRVSASQATFSWTPGTGGAEQRLYVGANKAEVEAGCPGIDSPACAVNLTGLPESQSSYTTANVLAPGTVYYWQIVNWQSESCTVASSTRTLLSSCGLSPSTLTLKVNQEQKLRNTIRDSSQIEKVTFTSDSEAVSLTPQTDTAYIYQTRVTAIAPGTATVTSDVYLTGSASPVCSAASSVVSEDKRDGWWQVEGGDISEDGANLQNTRNAKKCYNLRVLRFLAVNLCLPFPASFSPPKPSASWDSSRWGCTRAISLGY